MRGNIFLVGIFVLMNSAWQSQAQTWPTKPVRIISGLGAGSSMDLVARTIAPKLAEIWGQSVVIENRTGAAGNIAAGVVATTEDGHTLLIAQNAIAISASLYPKLSYNLRKDLKPVSQISSMPHVVVVNTNLPVKNFQEFVQLAKEKSGQLNFSSAGIGNADHMAAELLNSRAGILMVNVPFPGGAQAMNAVIAGDTQMYLPGLPVSVPQIKAGKVRALAVTSVKRSPSLPDVPTVAELGIPNFSTVLWYGLFSPTSHADTLNIKIASDLNKALNSVELQTKLAGIGLDLVGNSPDSFKTFVNQEIQMWEQIVRSKNLRPD
jgi:tripartite-type tricarboxylate transporter receptor subunit TctC